MLPVFRYCCGEGEEEAKFGSFVKAVGNTQSAGCMMMCLLTRTAGRRSKYSFVLHCVCGMTLERSDYNCDIPDWPMRSDGQRS